MPACEEIIHTGEILVGACISILPVSISCQAVSEARLMIVSYL